MDELVEFMARAQYAANSWWRAVGQNDDGLGRYKMHGDVRLRALDWEHLDAEEQDDFRQSARAILSALSSKGLAVVPVEPTEAMLEAGVYAVDELLHGEGASAPSDAETERCCWKAMLAAAPKEGQGA